MIHRVDDEAFREHYRNRRLFSKIASTIVNSPEDIEEATQDALFAAWRRYGARAHKNQIAKATQRKAIDKLRSNKKAQNDVSLEDITQPDKDPRLSSHAAQSAESEAMRDETRREVRAALNQLPDNHRQALLLSLDGLTPEEIAQKLQVNRSTARSWLKRGKSRLRELLKDLT